MQITAQMVKELRERTGAPMMDCKQALVETSGKIEQAVDVLRKKGIAAAAKKAGRKASEGTIGAYIHPGGRIGVLVEVACETDFVARTDDFQELVKDLAMHVAAAEPRFVRREEVSADVLDRERAVYEEQARAGGKPEEIVRRIVDGKLEKFYKEAVALEQPFVKDPDLTVTQRIAAAVGKLGENIQLKRFARYRLGEDDGADAAPAEGGEEAATAAN